jgi:predicted nucleic acid-binding Zn ribbon protein
MSSGTCSVCSGAIPERETVVGHTALCAEIVRVRARSHALKEVVEVLEALAANPMASAADRIGMLGAARIVRGMFL